MLADKDLRASRGVSTSIPGLCLFFRVERDLLGGREPSGAQEAGEEAQVGGHHLCASLSHCLVGGPSQMWTALRP